jgi:hypothetical protein
VEDKKMIGKRGLVAIVTVLVCLLTLTSNAANPLSKEDLQKLIASNTVEGQSVQWKKKMTWYFNVTGLIKQLDEYGNRGQGRWRVSEKGELCVEFKHGGEHCRKVVPRTEGSYDVYEDDGTHVWIFETVLPNNPKDL